MAIALQTTGLLCALIFVISAIFEVLISNHLYVSQYWLITLLLEVFAIWALIEVLRPSRHPYSKPQRMLRLLLILQIGIVGARHLPHFNFQARLRSELATSVEAHNISTTILFSLVSLLLYLAISHYIIDSFSIRERDRANELQERNLQLLQVQGHLKATQAYQQNMERQQRTQLEQKLKTSLTAAAVVHEIQQPLSAILLNCRSARRWLEGQPAAKGLEHLLANLDQLSRDSEQVVATMERMRMLLRNVETEHGPIDLVTYLKNGLLFLKNELTNAEVELKLQGLDQPCFLNGDGSQLQIAIINLIRNSLQAMEAQSPESRRLLIQLKRHATRLELQVADSGPGFPEGFSKETSWELLKSTKASGMGIGLFIAHTAATNHCGELHVSRSARLGGAEVLINLPLPVTVAQGHQKDEPPAN